MDNARTRPPPDEVVEWRAFWLVEAFPLSLNQALIAAIRHLQRRHYGLGSTRLDELVARISRRAGTAGGSSWSMLDWAKPRDRYGHIAGYDIPLPDAIDHVRFALYSPIPELHLLVACFVFNEEARVRPTALINRDYVSTAARLASGTSLYNADAHKERAVRALRFESKQEAALWLRESVRARGLFAGGELDGRLPAVEFWTTRLAEPNNSRSRIAYLDTLGLSRGFSTWSATTLPGLHLTEAESDAPTLDLGPEDSHSLTLAARERDLYAGIDWDELHVGERDHWSELGYLEPDASSLAAGAGLLSMVEVFERRLGNVSEDLLGLNVGAPREANSRFPATETAFIRLASDALPIATALRAHRQWLARTFKYYRGTDFTSDQKDSSRTWFDGLVENAIDRMTLLRSRIEDARTIHGVVSNAIASRSSLRLQRVLTRLTYLLVLLALLSAGFAAVAVWDNIRGLLERLF